jgi:hypothetical protein
MPAKKVTPVAFAKMEAKVEALESEISVLRSTLADVQNSVKENHTTLIAMLEKCLGKSVVVDEGSASVVANSKPAAQATPEKITVKGVGSSGIRGDTLTEFRQSIKKVELPSFNGEDPAGWISRAKIYFRVQDTTPELKVNLAQLCMEGPTIHFFNSLIGEDEDLSWTKLKEALLERSWGR